MYHYCSRAISVLLHLYDPCVYAQAVTDVTVVAMDDILYSRTVQDCERFCDDVSLFLSDIDYLSINIYISIYLLHYIHLIYFDKN